MIQEGFSKAQRRTQLSVQIYKVILRESVLPFALTMSPNSQDWVFQQDGAPCLTARSIKGTVCMQDHQFKTLSWQTQSLERWMATRHQRELGCLNFSTRSDIKSPNSNMKDWWRACEDTWKLLIEKNLGYSTKYRLVSLVSFVLVCLVLIIYIIMLIITILGSIQVMLTLRVPSVTINGLLFKKNSNQAWSASSQTRGSPQCNFFVKQPPSDFSSQKNID